MSEPEPPRGMEQVAFGRDIVFDLNKSVYFDMNGEAVWSELSRDFFINLHKHIMGALDDTTLRFFLTHAVY